MLGSRLQPIAREVVLVPSIRHFAQSWVGGHFSTDPSHDLRTILNEILREARNTEVRLFHRIEKLSREELSLWDTISPLLSSLQSATSRSVKNLDPVAQTEAKKLYKKFC